MIGAVFTAVVAVLVLTDHIAIWHIYVWAVIRGLVILFSRPAYKVILTGSVPANEVRSAVSINSMTETSAMVIVSGAGSVLLGVMGLALAFILNTVTYLIAAACFWTRHDFSRQSDSMLCFSGLDQRRSACSFCVFSCRFFLDGVAGGTWRGDIRSGRLEYQPYSRSGKTVISSATSSVHINGLHLGFHPGDVMGWYCH